VVLTVVGFVGLVVSSRTALCGTAVIALDGIRLSFILCGNEAESLEALGNEGWVLEGACCSCSWAVVNRLPLLIEDLMVSNICAGGVLGLNL